MAGRKNRRQSCHAEYSGTPGSTKMQYILLRGNPYNTNYLLSLQKCRDVVAKLAN